eukprot:jgi/Mesvir1/22839/Mv20099-RA.1
MGYRIPPRSLLAGKHDFARPRPFVTLFRKCRSCGIPSWTSVRKWFSNLFKYETDPDDHDGTQHAKPDITTQVMLSDELGNYERKGVLSSPVHPHSHPQGKELESDSWMVHPCSPFRRFWDIMTIVMLLYISILIPFRIAFAVRDELAWMIADRAVDVFFVADIVLNFFTGAIVDGKVIMKRSEVASMYLRSWFVVDVVAAIPYDVIAEVIMTGTIASESQSKYYLRSAKLLRFARLAKVMRLIRLIKMVRMSRMVEQLKSSVRVRRSILHIARFIIIVLFTAHWSGCIMFLISSLGAEECDRYLSVECELYPPTVMQHNLWGIDHVGTGTQYLNMFYWAIGTMSTIGYGDLVPITNKEKAFALVVIFVGASIFAYGVADMCNVIVNLNQPESTFTKLLDGMNDYMDYRCLPKSLRERIRQFLAYKKQRSLVAWHNEQALHAELSPSLRAEMKTFIYKNVVAEIELFSTAGPAFQAAACQRMHGSPYAPGDVIFKEGDMGAEMYIICRGSVELRKQDGNFDPRCSHVAGHGTLVGTLHEGQVFGEIAIFYPGRRMVTARALTYCDICFLTKADMDALSLDFGEVMDELRHAALENVSRDGVKSATVFAPAVSTMRRPVAGLNQSLASIAFDPGSEPGCGPGTQALSRRTTIDSNTAGNGSGVPVFNWLQHFSPKGVASTPSSEEAMAPLMRVPLGGDYGATGKIRKLTKVGSHGYGQGGGSSSDRSAIPSRQASVESLTSPRISEESGVSQNETARLLAPDTEPMSWSAMSPTEGGGGHPTGLVTQGTTGMLGSVHASSVGVHGAGSSGSGGPGGMSVKRLLSRSRVAPAPLLPENGISSSGPVGGGDSRQVIATGLFNPGEQGAGADAACLEEDLRDRAHASPVNGNQVATTGVVRTSLEIEAATGKNHIGAALGE